ncbi:MAG TPA: 5'-3' exonuclease H3TH domain-containing protein [Bacteroidota bacterium]|jgi:5'-3' exonuclease
MKIHLIDGTYELFRNYFGAPKRQAPDGSEVGATVGLVRSLISLLHTHGTTHLACAFDHVIKSFRNKLYAGYKTEEGVDKELLAQFSLAEKAVSALGIVVWPMVEFEADDALSTAASRFRDAKGVDQVVICSPDKDLAQSVRGKKVVCWDRRREIVLDEKGVLQKFGVRPESIPDWLALVGDSADGYPGIPGWGEKSTSAVLARFRHLEQIPADFKKWRVPVSRAQYLSENLEGHRIDALLFRRLATLREDVPLREKLPDLKWRGAKRSFKSLCADLGVNTLPERISAWRS